MLQSLTKAWSWLVDGAAEATIWTADRLRRRAVVRIDLDDAGGTIIAADGTPLARLVEQGDALALDPPAAAQRIAAAAVEVHCPPDWLFRRTLAPVAAQGAPFLDAFVRHQIDRLTPWRVEDVDYAISQSLLPGDHSRVAIEIGAVPKRATAAAFAVIRACHPARLVLVARGAQDDRRFKMTISDNALLRVARIKPIVVLALLLYLAAWPGALAWLWWTTAVVADEIAASDQVIDARKALLAASARHDRAAEMGSALVAMRAQRLPVVELIDALSAAVPDSAYVTELTIDGHDLRVSGISTDTSQLVPALENSGRFANATFFETTTRVEGGRGDRFHIAMQARPQATTQSVP